MINFPTVVCFIDLSDLLENDSACSRHTLLNGSANALFIEFEHLFTTTDARKTCETVEQSQTWI